jgi:hypothetical protein
VDYAASKGAIDTFTIGSAHEVAEEGIRVNAVRPGFIYTEMHASGGEPNRVDRVKRLVPMKRGGTPEEVARAILWLLSDEASFTTGAFIEVTGGSRRPSRTESRSWNRSVTHSPPVAELAGLADGEPGEADRKQALKASLSVPTG